MRDTTLGPRVGTGNTPSHYDRMNQAMNWRWEAGRSAARMRSRPNAMKGVPVGTPSTVDPQLAAPSKAAFSAGSVYPDRVQADRALALLGETGVVLERRHVCGVVPALGPNHEVASELEGGGDRELVHARLADAETRAAVVLERLGTESEHERTGRADLRVAGKAVPGRVAARRDDART